MAGFPGRQFAGGAALLLLAACVTEGGPGAGPAPGTGDCGAAGLQQLVGQPASTLETMRFSQPLRVINPGQMVTMDYIEARLNISVDEAGRISRVSCG